MKKIFLICLLILLTPFLSGCVIFSSWVLKGDGKNLAGGYGIVTGEARRADIIGLRYLLITTQKVDKKLLEKLPLVRIVVDNDNKAKDVQIGPEQNFGPVE